MKCVYLKGEKALNQSSKLSFQDTRKEEQSKPKASRRKETIKVEAEINEVENGKIIEKTNETKSWFSKKNNKINNNTDKGKIREESND